MQKVRNLKRSKIYLCGQIEHDTSNAAPWRKEITSDLLNIEPEIIVWNPLIKPKWMSEDARDDIIAFNKCDMFMRDLYGDVSKNKREKLRHRGWAAAHEIRRVCKKLASASDILIARITETFTWGSIDELEIAARDNKPVFFWFPDGPVSTYGVPGCVPNHNLIDSYVFYRKDKLLEAIRKISDGSSNLLIDDPFAWTYLTYTNSINYSEK